MVLQTTSFQAHPQASRTATPLGSAPQNRCDTQGAIPADWQSQIRSVCWNETGPLQTVGFEFTNAPTPMHLDPWLILELALLGLGSGFLAGLLGIGGAC